jgi:hypothetical protein
MISGHLDVLPARLTRTCIELLHAMSR